MYVRTYVRMYYVCMHEFVYICVHVRMYMHTYNYRCVHAYMYVRIYYIKLKRASTDPEMNQ